MHDPIAALAALWERARQGLGPPHRNAACVSTIDEDGFPNARFVDLKDVTAHGLVFCTSFESAKALELRVNPNASMAMWWEHVGTQVRIKGACEPISDAEAEKYWLSRPRDAQLVSVAFRQSHRMHSAETLDAAFAEAVDQYATRAVPRPNAWGGFRLVPLRFEFLEFRETRLHLRTAFVRDGGRWHSSLMQP